MDYSKDYIAGWCAARAQYQARGGVMPYPAGFSPEPVDLTEAVEPPVKAKKSKKTEPHEGVV